jgi:signal transduction histidine kinase
MKMWGKRTEGAINVAALCATGLSREGLLRKALQTLSSAGRADRIGVWLEAPGTASKDAHAGGGFRGMVWDRDGKNEDIPVEWSQLSLEGPLPHDALISGLSVEQKLEDPAPLVIGPLLQMRRAVWVPVARKGQLRGVLLAGSRSRHGELPRQLLESTAAELAVAMELEEEEHLVNVREADLQFTGGVLMMLNAQEQPELVLKAIVENCTGTAPSGDGLGVRFAAIGFQMGERRQAPPDRVLDGGCGGPPMAFYWTSGDPGWTESIERNVAAETWRKAVETSRLAIEEFDPRLARDNIARILAIPLHAERKLIGVFVAGLPPECVVPGASERLELRAALATSALRAWKRAQEATREAAWRKALIDGAGEPTILLDAHGRIVDANGSAKALLRDDQKRENAGLGIKGAPVRLAQVFQASDQPRIEAWWVRALSGTGERRGKQRNGPGELPEAVLTSGVRVRLRPALPVGGPYAAIILDTWHGLDAAPPDKAAVTELRNVLEWLDEGVIVFDAQENVRVMNTRFLQIAGLDGADATELPTLDHLIYKVSGRVAEPWGFAQRWRNLARGIDADIREELEFVRPAERIVQREARPILDSACRRVGRVEVYRDLTAQRGLQSRLLHTEKLAALGQLLTQVAHELNNPLTNIFGYSQRLLENEANGGNGKEIRQIRQILTEAERAKAILQQLLHNARESKAELHPVSLNEVVLQALEVQQQSLAQENIHLEVDLDSACPLVYGDAGQLQQVLMNLTGNARQALDRSGKSGTIRVRTKQIGDQRVLLEIADNGPGIPKEIVGRIFDPFFTTKPAGIGTGLGLAIVSGIVREHGGFVKVASPPNGGAIFSIALPAASTAPGEARSLPQLLATSDPHQGYLGSTVSSQIVPGPAAGDSANPSFQGISRAGSHRILVVEDEPTVARLIADVLEDEGFQVDVLFDGQEALKQAARETYDLVVCDMKMPWLDGQHFYKALVQADNSLNERFLFVTGDVLSPRTHQFLERHHLPHVAKPFRMEELKDRVRGLLQRNFSHEGKTVPVRKNG